MIKAVRIAARLMLVAWLAAGLPAPAEGPHVHGVAKLDVALEGSALTLELHAPLEDLAGFERQPANDRERGILRGVVSYLRSGNAFVPNAAAGCRQGTAVVETRGRGRDHLEIAATLIYECADAGALKQVEAALFSRFARLKRIDVRIATARGQSAARLTPARRSFALHDRVAVRQE